MIPVVIAPNGLHRRDRAERLQGLSAVDVARVQDQVDAAEGLEQSIGKAVDELRAVSVSDHANTSWRQPAIPAACSPAWWATIESAPPSSALTAPVAKACACGVGSFRSMLPSENHAQ